MHSIKDLKANRNSMYDNLVRKIDEVNKAASKKGFIDERYWRPTKDKTNNSTAIIRFMPPPAGEEMPFVEFWKHEFFLTTSGSKRWYIEKSLENIGEYDDDPVSQIKSKLYAMDTPGSKELAKTMNRRKKCIANIYVVSDHGNPDNDGKVFLYEFGKKIKDKILARFPSDNEEDDGFEVDKFNVFDPWDGANFKLVVKGNDYDDSHFGKQSPLDEDDSVIEKAWNSCYSLQEELDPKNFKSYEQLKKRLVFVIGDAKVTRLLETSRNPVAEEDDVPWKEESEPQPTMATSSTTTDEEDDLSWFRNIANDD